METTERRSKPKSSVPWGRIIVAALLVVVVVAVAIDNRHDTRVGFVFGDANAPLFAVLVVTAVIGALIGWLLLHRPQRHHD